MKKSIFLFFAAILCATNAWGAKLFFDCSSVNYPADGALVAIWSWGGSSSDAWSVFKASGATNKIVADIADGRTGGKIVRFNSSVTKPDWNASQWNSTGDISFPSDKNCLKITSWDGATTGTWSKFQLESQASITPSASSVSVGEEVTFTPALTSNQEYNDVLSTTYSVGAGATITDGKFVATEAGTYTVTATVTYNAQGYTNITKTATATCSITVTAVAVPHPVTGVTIAPTSVTIKQGATTTLTATVSPSNADDPSITWSSDNTSVATVVNGVVTAVAAGTANITVTTVDGGFTATCAVKVKPLQYTFYAINSAEWPTVAAHYWGGADGGSSWPGADMVKESETVNGCDIYSITISSDFINIMFTNQLIGDDKNKKTADLTTEGNDGKYYDIKDAKWYASLSEVPVSYDYYITGSFNSNNPKNAENGMTFDGEVYKATVTLAEGDNTLKVTDGTWDKTWGANELGAAYEEVSNPNDYNNIKITLAAEAEKEITVIFDATAGKITFEGLTPYVAPLTYTVTVPAGTEKCYIAGPKNDWSFQEMTATANENEFTITITGAKETDEYKYACQADWAYAEVIEGGGNRTAWSALDEVTAWNKPVVYTYYLMGVNDDWATGIEMEVNTDAENEVMITCQPVNGEVKIKRLGDDASEYWYGGKSLKAEEGNLGTNTGTGDEDGNILLEEGIYNFYFNTADGKLWIAAATGCVIEPEYNVVEDYITNFVFDTEAWPMVCMGGPSTTYQVEVFLTLTEDADGTLAYEDCSVSIMGTDATFIDGTLSNIDPYAPYADAVLHVQWDGDYYELQLAMSSTPAEAITIEAEDATVTLTEYPTNFEGTEFAYELAMVANWVNEAESLPYTVEFVIPTFDPTAASGEYIANFYVTGEGDAAGMNENVTVTVTKDGNNVTLTGNVSALNGNAYNVTISGTLPVAAPDYTRTVTPGYYGTICLPYGSSYMTGATFFETSHIEGDKVYFNEVTTLKAGHAYIFLARTDKIAIYKEGDETVVTPIAKNGLYGTFDPITDVAAESANDEYIIVYNNTTAQCELSMCGNNCSLEANRAYVVLSEIGTEPVQLMPGCRRIGMSVQGENEATGFENITAPAGKTIKAVVNSQLIIIRDGEMYNAQGVRL